MIKTRQREQAKNNELLNNHIEQIAINLAMVGINIKYMDSLRGKVNTDVWEAFVFIEQIILQQIPIGYDKKFKNWLNQYMTLKVGKGTIQR